MHVIHRTMVQPILADDGSLIRELAAPGNAPLAAHSVAEIRHPVGTASREHYHGVAEEVYYVLEGEGEVRVDGQSQAIGPGDVVAISPGQRHKVAQRGDKDLVLLVTCVPAYSPAEVVFLE
ncbi:MAG TPA: cupin domain-containing protein [Anaerolineae bacterium]|nr:cupin domain-containing protein [Anaerolineae bacterium]